MWHWVSVLVGREYGKIRRLTFIAPGEIYYLSVVNAIVALTLRQEVHC